MNSPLERLEYERLNIMLTDILNDYYIEYYTRINGHMTRHLQEAGNDFNTAMDMLHMLCRRSDVHQVILNYLDTEIADTGDINYESAN